MVKVPILQPSRSDSPAADARSSQRGLPLEPVQDVVQRSYPEGLRHLSDDGAGVDDDTLRVTVDGANP